MIMNSTSLAQKPPLYLTTLDYERLEALADDLPGADSGTKSALLEELARASVVAPGEIPADTVTMYSVVRLRVDAREVCKTLVYPRDAVDPDNHLSVLTPVGVALIGLRKGSVIEWPSPGGRMLRIEVLDVLHQPEKPAVFQAPAGPQPGATGLART